MTIGVGLPGMGMGMPVALEAEADYADGLLVLADSRARSTRRRVSGDVNAVVKDGKPHLTGQLDLDALPSTVFAAMVLGEAALASAEDGEWSSVPFQQKAAAPFSADLTIAAATLSAGAFAHAYDASLSLRLDGEGFRVRRSLGETLRRRSRRTVRAEEQWRDRAVFGPDETDGGRSRNGAWREPASSGTGDFSTALSASGKSVGGLVPALSGSGTAALTVADGVGGQSRCLHSLHRQGGQHRQATSMRPKPRRSRREIAAAGTFSSEPVDIAFTVAGGILRAPPVTLENAGSLARGRRPGGSEHSSDRRQRAPSPMRPATRRWSVRSLPFASVSTVRSGRPIGSSTPNRWRSS